MVCLLLGACGAPEDSQGVPPGTMKLVSVVPLGALGSSSEMLANGDFSEFWAGADLPTHFGLGGAGKVTQVTRAPGDGAIYRSSIKQTWKGADGNLKPGDRFHARIKGLSPNTDYCLTVAGRVDDGSLAAIDIDGIGAEGPKRLVPHAVRMVLATEAPQVKKAWFNTGEFEEIALSSKLLGGSPLPAAATWYLWSVRQEPKGPTSDDDAMLNASLDSIRPLLQRQSGYPEWLKAVSPAREQWRGLAALLQEDAAGAIVGQEGFSFRREGINTLLATDFVYDRAENTKEGGPSASFRALQAMWQALTLKETPLLVAIVPGRTAIQAGKLFPAVPAGDLMPERVEFVRVLALAGVPVHDLGELFQSTADPAGLLEPSANQLTETGVQAVGAALAERIKSSFKADSILLTGEYAGSPGLGDALGAAAGLKVTVAAMKDTDVPAKIVADDTKTVPEVLVLFLLDTESLLRDGDGAWKTQPAESAS